MTDTVTDPTVYPKAFEAALNAGDIDRIVALYDDEAVLRGQSNEVHSGPDAVRAEMQQLVASGANITNTLRHVFQHDDTALIIVDYVLKLTPPGGDPVEMTGTATNVIRNDLQTGWRMIIANPQGVA